MGQKILLLLLVTLAIFQFCSLDPGVKSHPDRSNKKERAKRTELQMTALENGVYQTGIASWYGKDFHGKRTANGEIYDMNIMTAAHKELPFHTFVEVENLDNGRKIVVRINDRGPFVKGRIIDLSYKAAKRLGSAEQGTARVNLRIIEGGTARVTPQPRTLPVPGLREESPDMGFYLQAGAFSDRANALRMVQSLGGMLPGLSFKVANLDGLYKVISQSLPNRQKAEEFQRLLQDRGIDVFIKEY